MRFYPGIQEDTGGISGVFLVNLKIGLMHYEKPYICINQMQHLHACSSLMFWPLMVWISIPESMHRFNQFVYAGCAAKSVKPRPKSESWLDNSDVAPSQCFKKKKKEKKLSPDFLLHMIFNLCPLKYFLKINQVFRFRNQSLSIPCKDVLFKSNLNQGLTNSTACWHRCIAFPCAL